jgi:hypothetical protein
LLWITKYYFCVYFESLNMKIMLKLTCWLLFSKKKHFSVFIPENFNINSTKICLCYLKHVSFLSFASILRLEHLFSPSNNNRLTWRHSMYFCTSAPSPRCHDESAHHVRRCDGTTFCWEEFQV